MSNKFLRTEDGVDYFDFNCSCGAAGELGVATENAMEPFGCPEGCGATYVRWRPDKIPALKCVVQPVYLVCPSNPPPSSP